MGSLPTQKGIIAYVIRINTSDLYPDNKRVCLVHLTNYVRLEKDLFVSNLDRQYQCQSTSRVKQKHCQGLGHR